MFYILSFIMVIFGLLTNNMIVILVAFGFGLLEVIEYAILTWRKTHTVWTKEIEAEVERQIKPILDIVEDLKINEKR